MRLRGLLRLLHRYLLGELRRRLGKLGKLRRWLRLPLRRSRLRKRLRHHLLRL